MNIFDSITAPEIGTYYTTNGSNQIPYLGATLFPPKKQLGLDLSWIKAANGLPIALQPAEFDTKASIRNRIGFSKIETEMPFFRESMKIGEKDRQELNKAQGAANAQYIMPVITRIFDDATNLVNGAEVDNERMRMQLLSTGMIAISANGIAYNYDYKFKSSHKETLLTTAKWSDTANSDPLSDIKRWQDTIEDDSGVRPTNAICTRKTWNYLLSNQKVRLAVNTLNSNGANVAITDTQLKQYLATSYTLQVAVYNKKYALQDGSSHLFYPDETFTLFPDGNLGNTYFGTTPEESDLMTGVTDAQVSIVNTGVAITTIKHPHPVNVETIVSEIALPSFETIDSIFIATIG
ncbi:phage major capsid protein E [Clostridium acetobutylicum]|nr:phage major capsid protein E [Clostridium acetobutylicum]